MARKMKLCRTWKEAHSKEGRIALLILDVSKVDAYVRAIPPQLPPCQGKRPSGPLGDSLAMLWEGGKAPWGGSLFLSLGYR